jgi:hypothetical protein
MKEKNIQSSHNLRAVFIIAPAILIGIAASASALFRLVYGDAGWLNILARAALIAAAVNPGAFLLLPPLRAALNKAAGGYMVKEAVTMEGVGRETLDRSAAIAEGESSHPIAVCLRAFCGDVAAPPDKYAEIPGLGVSAQFSGQMIHAGSAEYMKGLNITAPDVRGCAAFIALEDRLLGYYRFADPSEIRDMKLRLTAALAVCSVLKLAVWALAAFTGTALLPVMAAGEIASVLTGVAAVSLNRQ